MAEGITRNEILKKIKNLPRGSFDLYAARAGVSKIGTRVNKKCPHISENLYPSDSVDKIKSVMPNRGEQK